MIRLIRALELVIHSSDIFKLYVKVCCCWMYLTFSLFLFLSASFSMNKVFYLQFETLKMKFKIFVCLFACLISMKQVLCLYWFLNCTRNTPYYQLENCNDLIPQVADPRALHCHLKIVGYTGYKGMQLSAGMQTESILNATT